MTNPLSAMIFSARRNARVQGLFHFKPGPLLSRFRQGEHMTIQKKIRSSRCCDRITCARPSLRERRNWKTGQRNHLLHIGNPQSFGQRPSPAAPALALCEYPALMDIFAVFPADAVEPLGHPRGKPARNGCLQRERRLRFIREAVAECIRERDGIGARSEAIFLTDGASKGVQTILSSCWPPTDGIMIPIPSTRL